MWAGSYTVSLLKEAGFSNITAVDFSLTSLMINRECNNSVDWLCADLNDMSFEKDSFDVILMADFLQHLGSFKDKLDFLDRIVIGLRPGGKAYLSFFNLNLVNYLKSDIHRTFSDGAIPYERLKRKEILRFLRDKVVIESVQAMNVTNIYQVDKAICKWPLSDLFSRMSVIEFYKE